MKKLWLLAILVMPILVQSQVLKGKVTDHHKQAIAEAYLLNKRNQIHTHTDNTGNFQLDQVQIGDTLVIGRLGYHTQEWIISNKHIEQYSTIILESKIVDLGEVVISKNIKALNAISDVDIAANPVNSSQEVLRTVPGLVIGQHAGGGKAEQIFLRGFDIDHGTDVSISTDGIPVNMVSHAHGQGYADLHYIIPETIENIDFGKGPYYEAKGNFATAGYVDFKTKDQLEHSLMSLEIGSFNTLRNVGMFKLLNKPNNQAYVAYEFLQSDGPFESSQNFSRSNFMGKYVLALPNNGKITVMASRFSSKWDASGQIPQRAVDLGMISRFGAIDDTEGGTTSRSNFSVKLSKFIDKDTWLTSQLWYSKYDFDLFSNFTFYLNDPINGDQIRQKENRNLYGSHTEIKHLKKLGNTDLSFNLGFGFRFDEVNDSELSHTKDRFEVITPIQKGDISESNFYGFYGVDIHIGKWMINPVIRVDHFNFQYQDHLSNTFSTESAKKTTISPKLNFIYALNDQMQFFLKTGKGFHSNDTRVILSQNMKDAVPAVYGADLGALWKPSKRLFMNIALWYLHMDQEFIYVGDEGVVEAGGKTKRFGLDYGFRYQLSKELYLVGDLNYACARSIDEPKGANYIPLAPDLSSAGGLYYKHTSGFSGGIKYRYIKNRPANETNSIIAKGYFITDLNLSYHYAHWGLDIDIQNLFDRAWNETQFATETRLYDETEAVEEIHFIPGSPFFIKAKLSYCF